MDEMLVEDVLKAAGSWQTGHFVLRHPTDNPRHSGDYLDNDPLMANERVLSQLAQAIAEQVQEAGLKVGVVTGPAEGGMRLAEQVAKYLSPPRGHRVAVARNRKTHDERFPFDFGSDTLQLRRGGNVLVVEDTVTSGQSINHILALVREAGGEVAGVACILNRGQATADTFGTHTFLRLINRQLPLHDPGLNPGDFTHSGCPLCKLGIEIDMTRGRGRWFVDQYGQPPKSR